MLIFDSNKRGAFRMFSNILYFAACDKDHPFGVVAGSTAELSIGGPGACSDDSTLFCMASSLLFSAKTFEAQQEIGGFCVVDFLRVYSVDSFGTSCPSESFGILPSLEVSHCELRTAPTAPVSQCQASWE